jgi:hypothetical protein
VPPRYIEDSDTHTSEDDQRQSAPEQELGTAAYDEAVDGDPAAALWWGGDGQESLVFALREAADERYLLLVGSARVVGSELHSSTVDGHF